MNRSVAIPIAALGSGIVFGVGLAVSRMTDPNKILSFLNVLGPWDPSLLLVMGSALIVAAIGYRIALGSAPIFDSKFHLPGNTRIDRRLLVGAAVFGIGWGLGGFCPGPAIAALSGGNMNVIIFILALVVGGWVTDRIAGRGTVPGLTA